MLDVKKTTIDNGGRLIYSTILILKDHSTVFKCNATGS